MYYQISNNYYYQVRCYMIKYSRQRESILSAIADRTDHPTADTIYVEIREEYPNISWVFFRMPFLLFFRDYPRWLVKLSSGPHEDSFVAG